MASTFTFGSVLLPAGSRVLGPVIVPANWAGLRLVLDGAAQVGELSLKIEWSGNGGTTWQVIAGATFDPGTWLDKQGNPQTYRDLTVQFPAGVPGANQQLRLTLDNAFAWTTAGGTLTVI
jgi:hypothetical protein